MRELCEDWRDTDSVWETPTGAEEATGVGVLVRVGVRAAAFFKFCLYKSLAVGPLNDPHVCSLCKGRAELDATGAFAFNLSSSPWYGSMTTVSWLVVDDATEDWESDRSMPTKTAGR